ncbi:hypothetical protein [Knoellia aerolata]|uniref:Heavy metal-binding domain-containing protein n=1 Tax=Knoellia aerolata DSM 18566 TaxID=1385519 RepID=A0A0A0JXY5_9MICO|nr:hypothetical protein [Knoellia aerolata]KGN40932.1 hypothetical protein N801_10095 [Knoellia aerolata DSM 18566]
MSTPVRVVAFLAALAAVFGITLAAGRVIGPVGSASASASDDRHGHAGEPQPEPEPTRAGSLPRGLQVSQDGYALRLDPDAFAAAPRGELELVIEGPDGKPVTEFTTQHEKELHLIVVRRDFSGFRHVHPTRADDGTWSTPLDLAPGAWRVFADMAPAGAEPMTLGADLFVHGSYTPMTAPQKDVRTATVDGYTVTLEGDLVPGTDSDVTLSVSRDGAPVTDLQPYLGAYGHLVALRGGDLAYLHVHPEGEPGDGSTAPGPDITFGTSVPTSGTYRLFLDFRHGGVVRTAAFTVTAGTPLEPWKEDRFQ